jgi:hypothetical protein
MNRLRIEAWAAIVAFAITIVFNLNPGPYPMAAFTFIAQPLFGYAIVRYLWRVLGDLRTRKLL